jgi:3-hydroxyisobutyrate dehydrogenase
VTLDPGTAVGFVGLGHMGLPMAAHLVEAGYVVRGHDVDAAARAAFEKATGAEAAGGLAGAARARAVVLSLPSSPAVRRVLLDEGLLGAMEEGALVIDMGSSDPTQTRELAEIAAGHGVQLLDAPVSGGVRGARAGTLTIMAGGPEDRVAECRPLLETVGGKVLHVGPVGAGHALKALNNLLSATSLLVSSEALLAGRRFGLDPRVMLDVINGSSGRSYSTEHKLPDFVLPETFSAGFALRLMVKDIRTAVELAHATGTPIALGEATVALWEQAAAELPEDADHTEIARWLEARVPPPPD